MRVSSFIIGLMICLSACGTRLMQNQPTAHSAQEAEASRAATLPGQRWHVPDSDEDEAEEDAHGLAMDLDQMEGELPEAIEQAPHHLEDLSSREIESMVLENPEELGPASLGKTNSGALLSGLQMPTDSRMWKVVNPRETYGTTETINNLIHTIRRVNELYPNSPPLPIGDISRARGGHLVPHVSHQSGRDVDLGFYYKDQSRWYAKADARNLDLARTWAFVKITITETDVEAIFVDTSIQRLLRGYATEIGEDPTWLDQIFGGPTSRLRPMLIHEPGHKTHLHIRYYNPIAQETGRRVYRVLVKHKKIKPPTYYVKYKVKRGDTLKRIAKKHNSTVESLKKANRLKSNRIIAGRTYRIPRRGGVNQPGKLVLPQRRIPEEQTQVTMQGSGQSQQAVSVHSP